jgi:hypothetical protein
MSDMTIKNSQLSARAVRARADLLRENTKIESVQWKPAYTTDEIRKEQLKDPDVKLVYDWVQKGTRPNVGDIVMLPPILRHYWHIFHQLGVSNGILVMQTSKTDLDEEHFQIITPKSIKKEALLQAHVAPLGGHCGRRKTQKKLSRNFYWYGMKEDTSAPVAACVICQKNKKPTVRPRGRLRSMIVGSPMDRLSVDIVGPLPITTDKNRYILSVTDHFTNWAKAFAIPDQTAATVIEKLFDGIISRFAVQLLDTLRGTEKLKGSMEP